MKTMQWVMLFFCTSELSEKCFYMLTMINLIGEESIVNIISIR